jgi:hypothetical protein
LLPPLETFHAEVSERYPHYIQGVFTQQIDRYHEVVVITEPPPSVSISALERALKPLDTGNFVHPIGFDGWVRDLVFVIRHEGEVDLANKLAHLAELTFGTSYGFTPAAIAEPPPSSSEFNLNLSIGPGALDQILRDTRYFFAGENVDIQHALTSSGDFGIATGDAISLLILPKKSDLCEFQRELRMFALETDLVLGNIHTSDVIAIVARNRQVPHTILAPLRVEVMLQLAAHTDKSVQESQYRGSPVAGPTSYKRGRSWAPIELSANTVDTEFGGVLVLADQLLHVWLARGAIQFEGFEHPPPGQWPIINDEKAKTIKTRGSKSVHTPDFSWDASNLFFVLETPAYQLTAVRQTGALPIVDNDGRVSQKSELALTNQFANTNTPMFARVVQYSVIAQSFDVAEVTASCMDQEPSLAVATGLRAGLIDRMVATLKELRDGVDDVRSHDIRQRYQEVYGEELGAKDLGRLLSSAHKVLAGTTSETLQSLAEQLVLDTTLPRNLGRVRARLPPSGIFHSMLDLGALASNRSSSPTTTNPWSRTPRASVSIGEASPNTGGHNVEVTQVHRIRFDASVLAGHPKYQYKTSTLLINAEDRMKIDGSLIELSKPKVSVRRVASQLQTNERADYPTLARSSVDEPAAPPTRSSQHPGWRMEYQRTIDRTNTREATLTAPRIYRKDGDFAAELVVEDGAITFRGGSIAAIIEGLLEHAPGPLVGVWYSADFDELTRSALRQELDARGNTHSFVRSDTLIDKLDLQLLRTSSNYFRTDLVHSVLGLEEVSFQIVARSPNNSPVRLRVTARSSKPIAPWMLFQALIPSKPTPATIGDLILEIELRGRAEEGVTLRIGM